MPDISEDDESALGRIPTLTFLIFQLLSPDWIEYSGHGIPGSNAVLVTYIGCN